MKNCTRDVVWKTLEILDKMTMSEQQETSDEISFVASRTGCRPKIATVLQLKSEVSTTISSISNEDCSSNQHTAAKEDQVAYDKPSNLPDADNLLTAQPSTAPATSRSKHVRSFSDCTGFSSTQSNKPQGPSQSIVKNVVDSSSSLSGMFHGDLGKHVSKF